jgi:hypothetical protein
MNKFIFFSVAIAILTHLELYGQWAFNGDAISAGQFLGTTNTNPFLPLSVSAREPLRRRGTLRNSLPFPYQFRIITSRKSVIL